MEDNTVNKLVFEEDYETADYWDEDDAPDFPDAWVCDSDAKAEWCIQKYHEAEMEYTKWEKHYRLQLDRLKKRTDSCKAVMLQYLRRYFDQKETEGLVKQTKTQAAYQLPSGKLIKKPGTWDYTAKRDEPAMIAWLDEHDLADFIKTKLSVAWADLKPYTETVADGTVIMKDTGEVIEGLKAIKKPDSFELK